MDFDRAVTGWQIQALVSDSESLERAAQAWKALAAYRSPLSDSCIEEDIASEALWIQEALTAVLDQHAKPIRLTPYSKRWWGPKVKEARGAYAREYRAWKSGALGDAEHREAQNLFYRTIRKAKRECWENFLEGPQESRESLGPEDSARCWRALQYTKPRVNSATPTLRGPPPENQLATTFEEKETLAREIAFPTSPRNLDYERPPGGTMHRQVTIEVV